MQLGAGGFWGKGLGQSLIKFKLSYSYNDFILAIICEELGVFGVIVMMTLFGYLLYRIYKIAQNAWDIEGKVLAIGVFTQIALQLLINVMVVTSVIPTTGVTLPFLVRWYICCFPACGAWNGIKCGQVCKGTQIL